MPLLSDYAQKKKIAYFLNQIPKDAAILEIGCGAGWVADYLKSNGWNHYMGMDIVGPADIVGDIRQWRSLGLRETMFDVIIAFEVVEHVDCFRESYDLLKPGGMLMITTPVPHRDWILRLMEFAGLNQKRTSCHDHLVYLKNVSHFTDKKIRIVGGLSQWAIFRK